MIFASKQVILVTLGAAVLFACPVSGQILRPASGSTTLLSATLDATLKGPVPVNVCFRLEDGSYELRAESEDVADALVKGNLAVIPGTNGVDVNCIAQTKATSEKASDSSTLLSAALDASFKAPVTVSVCFRLDDGSYELRMESLDVADALMKGDLAIIPGTNGVDVDCISQAEAISEEASDSSTLLSAALVASVTGPVTINICFRLDDGSYELHMESPDVADALFKGDLAVIPGTNGVDVDCDPQVEAASSKKASGSGDPHFKTWTGDKFDYHGECDLVLVNNPSFANGLGMRVHIRTTRVKYFSYIEQIALQIGNEVLQFNNDVENFLINGMPVGAQRKTKIAGFVVRRDKKAISIRLDDSAKAKIDLIARRNGFPAVILDGGSHPEIFQGSLGLLGEWSTGKALARDGETYMDISKDATAFTLGWQVLDTDPMLFQEARFPQFPQKCIAPQKIMGNRLGMSSMQKKAEEACAHWKEDMEDCIFDVIATRSVVLAAEGNIMDVDNEME